MKVQIRRLLLVSFGRTFFDQMARCPPIGQPAAPRHLCLVKRLAGRVDGRGGLGGEGEEGHVTPEPDPMLHHVRHKRTFLWCPPFDLKGTVSPAQNRL